VNKSMIRFIQSELNQSGYACGNADGICGPRTLEQLNHALAAFAMRPAQPNGLPADWERWSKRRKLTAYIQALASQEQIEPGAIDGYWGPQTDFAYETLSFLREHGRLPDPWRDVEGREGNPNFWPSEDEDELIRYYGEVGKNQARIQLPYRHRLAWNLTTTIQSFSCHERVHDSLKRVLERVLDHYGAQRIQELRLDLWGGCLNVRKKRGGTRWSLHSWGVAVDYDPSHNPLRAGRDRAAFAHPDYDAWWRFWEEEGWVSLGRSANFDWMHVQAAKRS